MSRGFCFTWNNYPEDACDTVKGWDASYIVCGKEKGEGGTPHLQGFVIFRRTYRLKGLKAAFAKQIHWELPLPCASDEQRIAYCKKEGDWFEVGGEQGRRTDIENAYHEAEEGTEIVTYLKRHKPNYQTFRVFQLAQLYMTKPRPIGPIEVINCVGPKGAGKTKWCWETYPDLYKVESEKWWDGYTNQETILFDDWRYFNLSYWLNILDIYPLRREVKGGYIHLQFKRVLITGPRPLADMMQEVHEREDMDQLRRRITEIKTFEKV